MVVFMKKLDTPTTAVSPGESEVERVAELLVGLVYSETQRRAVARKLLTSLPSRESIVAETVERCAAKAETYFDPSFCGEPFVDAGNEIAAAIRRLTPVTEEPE